MHAQESGGAGVCAGRRCPQNLPVARHHHDFSDPLPSQPPDQAAAYRAGAPDAYGLAPERRVSPGGYPCRHCLGDIGEGDPYLTLAYRPFPRLQPYAETGPIFLHAEPCPRYEAVEVLPPMLESPDYILRGYGGDDRIVYGSGGVVARQAIIGRAHELFADPRIAYLHVRSARNNCYQCRVERGADMSLMNAG